MLDIARNRIVTLSSSPMVLLLAGGVVGCIDDHTGMSEGFEESATEASATEAGGFDSGGEDDDETDPEGEGITGMGSGHPANLPPYYTYLRFEASGYIPANSKYVPVGPTRLLDTRLNGQQYVGPLSNAQVIPVTLAGLAGLPQANAIGAVVLNVTVVPQKAGYLTVYPEAALPNPLTSNINFAEVENTAGLVIIAPGPDGKINLRHATVQGFSSHIVVDVFGYFPPDADIHMVQPKRVFDSGQPLAANTTKDVQLGDGNLIPNQVGAIIANVTAVNPAGHGYATVYEQGMPKPVVECGVIPPETPSNLQYTGTTRANLVIIPLSDTGKATIYTSHSARYIVDVLGWFGQGVDFELIEPQCILNTATIVNWQFGNLHPIDINVVGDPIPNGVLAVFGTLWAVDPTGRGYLQAYPVPADPNFVPSTSNLNFNAGKTVLNSVLTAVSPEGEFRVMTNFPP